MKVVTEIDLRDLYRKEPFIVFSLPAGARLTPAAAQFLSERKITLNRAGQPGQKKEFQTQLKGSELVIKNHPRIKFRGQLDHLEAEAILAIIEVRREGLAALAGDLQWLLDLLRQIMRAEVTGQALPEIYFGGLDSQSIREYSHHPEKHLGVRHFTPGAGHGPIMGRLNLLRTLVRQVELAAVNAFYQADDCQSDAGVGQGVQREDLLAALNRASSAVYIMMCRLLAGNYYGVAGHDQLKG